MAIKTWRAAWAKGANAVGVAWSSQKGAAGQWARGLNERASARIYAWFDAVEAWSNDPERGKRVIESIESGLSARLRGLRRQALRGVGDRIVAFPAWREPDAASLHARWTSTLPRPGESAMCWAQRFAGALEDALARSSMGASFEPAASGGPWIKAPWRLAKHAFWALAWREFGPERKDLSARWRKVVSPVVHHESWDLARQCAPDILLPRMRREMWAAECSGSWRATRQAWMPWSNAVESRAYPYPRSSGSKASMVGAFIGWASRSAWFLAWAVPALAWGFCSVAFDCASWERRRKRMLLSRREQARFVASAAGALARAHDEGTWRASLEGGQELRTRVEGAALSARVSVEEEAPGAAVYDMCAWALAWLGPRERAAATMSWLAGMGLGAEQGVWDLEGQLSGEAQGLGCWSSRPCLKAGRIVSAFVGPKDWASPAVREAALAAAASPSWKLVGEHFTWAAWEPVARSGFPGASAASCAGLCAALDPASACRAFQAWAQSGLDKNDEPFRPDADRALVGAALGGHPGWRHSAVKEWRLDAGALPSLLALTLSNDFAAKAAAEAGMVRRDLAEDLGAMRSEPKAAAKVPSARRL
jgi:hypothetical protein